MWISTRFREALRYKSAISLYSYSLNIPLYRDIIIAISRRFLRIVSAFPQNPYDNSSVDKEDSNYIDNVNYKDSAGFDSVLSRIANL